MSTYNANFEDIGLAKWEKYYSGYIDDINYFLGFIDEDTEYEEPYLLNSSHIITERLSESSSIWIKRMVDNARYIIMTLEYYWEKKSCMNNLNFSQLELLDIKKSLIEAGSYLANNSEYDGEKYQQIIFTLANAYRTIDSYRYENDIAMWGSQVLQRHWVLVSQ